MLIPQIEVIKSSLEISSRNQVTGIIFLNLGDLKFPESTWNDSVVVILAWWIEALVLFFRGEIKTGELMFMEGPLRINLYDLQGETCVIKLLEGRPGQVLYEGIVRSFDLLSTVYASAVLVKDACHGAGWQSDDVDELCRKIDYAKEFLGRSLKSL